MSPAVSGSIEGMESRVGRGNTMIAMVENKGFALPDAECNNVLAALASFASRNARGASATLSQATPTHRPRAKTGVGADRLRSTLSPLP